MIGDNVVFCFNLMKYDVYVVGCDEVSVSCWGVVLIVIFGFDMLICVILFYYYFSIDDMLDYGLLLINVNCSKVNLSKLVLVDCDNFYGLKDCDYCKSIIDSGIFCIEYDLNDNLILLNSICLVCMMFDYIVSNFDDSCGNVVNGYVYCLVKSCNLILKGWVNQIDLKVNFEIGFIKYILVIGLEFSYEDVYNCLYVIIFGGGVGNICNV